MNNMNNKLNSNSKDENNDQIDLIPLFNIIKRNSVLISTITFGKDNNAVSSESNVNPPIVFLKMLKDLEVVSVTQFGCMLYYLEVLNNNYQSSINHIKNISDLIKEKNDIKNNGAGKFFDPKIHKFF